MIFRKAAIAVTGLATAALLSACTVYEPAPAYPPPPPAAYYYTPDPGYYYAPPAYGSFGVIFSNGYHRHWR
jgi:hypothetical protein